MAFVAKQEEAGLAAAGLAATRRRRRCCCCCCRRRRRAVRRGCLHGRGWHARIGLAWHTQGWAIAVRGPRWRRAAAGAIRAVAPVGEEHSEKYVSRRLAAMCRREQSARLWVKRRYPRPRFAAGGCRRRLRRRGSGGGEVRERVALGRHGFAFTYLVWFQSKAWIDSFLSIPDAESLPLCRMVLKLACVCVEHFPRCRHEWSGTLVVWA